MARVYYLEEEIVQSTDLMGLDFSDREQVTDAEFKKEARFQKNEELSLEDFETLFNDGTIDTYTHTIRILKY